MYVAVHYMLEPILCAPNDPDDARTLSDVTGDKIDEVSEPRPLEPARPESS